MDSSSISYTHLDVYKRQVLRETGLLDLNQLQQLVDRVVTLRQQFQDTNPHWVPERLEHRGFRLVERDPIYGHAHMRRFAYMLVAVNTASHIGVDPWTSVEEAWEPR